VSTTTSGHVTRTFEAATPHLLQSLIGVQDANLKQIVEAIPVRILSRSGKMLLTGEPAEVKIASDVIEAMQDRLMNNLPIDEAVVGNIIESALSSKFHQPDSSSLDEYIEEVVGFKGTGETIPEIKSAVKKSPISLEEAVTEKPEIEKPVDAVVSKNSDSVEQTETVQSEAEQTETPVEEREEKEETPSVIIRKKPSRKKLVKREKSTEKTALQEASAPAKFKTCSPMSVQPRSHGQAKYLQAIERNDLVFCSGPAGSGKTYLAVAMALYCLQKEIVRKIVLVRPAVEAGEKLGFLPGDMLAKVNPFLRPLLDALRDMIDYEQLEKYM
jgi:phosphate starvation-inducible protein PhoH